MDRLFLGNIKVHLTTIESTNIFAQELINNHSVKDGTVILADYQSGGKGQSGKSWISDRQKNLLCSYVLFPKHLAVKDQFLITQMVSLGVVDFLKEIISVDCEVKIKWPNDIFINQSKIAGILIENNIRGNTINSSVLGIGININQELFEGVNATSTFLLSRRKEDLKNCNEILSNKLEARYFQLLNKNYNDLKNDYLKLLYRWKTIASFTVKGISKKGEIVEIDDIGRIGIKFNNESSTSYFNMKEIVFEN